MQIKAFDICEHPIVFAFGEAVQVLLYHKTKKPKNSKMNPLTFGAADRT
jgi:hypothetical protein